MFKLLLWPIKLIFKILLWFIMMPINIFLAPVKMMWRMAQILIYLGIIVAIVVVVIQFV